MGKAHRAAGNRQMMRRAANCLSKLNDAVVTKVKRYWKGSGNGSDEYKLPHGEPYAGKRHVRFDEGAGVPDNKGRPALLYYGGIYDAVLGDL